MPLDNGIRELINKNLDTALEVYQDLKGSKESLKKFTSQFEDISNDYDFLHGYIEGELFGAAFHTVRTILKRKLESDERKEVVEIIKSKRNVVNDLISRVKSA